MDAPAKTKKPWGPVKKRVVVYGGILATLGVLIFVAWAVMFACFCRPVGPAMESKTETKSLEVALRGHVETLGGDIGERNVYNAAAYARAADYIRDAWKKSGYDVKESTAVVEKVSCRTLEVEIAGLSKEILLVGAHYDSVMGSNGANDNATGVAAMLEISRALRGEKPARTIRFVAFPNEEPPFFETDRMGSRAYAAEARRRGDPIRAMIALETIGYYTSAPSSQQYPPFFSAFYPSTGNFVGIVGNLKSRSLAHRTALYFREATDFPAEVCATFGWIPGVAWSDHGSFWLHGYEAVMVTDTAPYRYPDYHNSTDRPDKVCYPELARVTFGLIHAVRRLADETD